MDSVFESEGARLAWLINEVEARASNAIIDGPEPEDLEVFQVTASWLTRCFALAKGLAVLVQEELYAPACVLHRTVWELWIDWRHLLRTEDRRLNAAKVLFNAQLETLRLIDARPARFEDEPVGALRRDLADFEAQHPEASAAVREQRHKGHFHWSGLTYSKIERGFGGDVGIYGPLSWEAHGTVTTLRDVKIEVGDKPALFRFGQTEDAYRPDFLLFSAGGVLFHVYNDFADMWGLRAIELRNTE